MNGEAPSRIATSIESVVEPVYQLPVWGWLVMGLLLAGFSLWVYWGEKGRASFLFKVMLAGLRFATLLTIVWMLCGWFAIRFKTEKPEVVFVVDYSGSMATPDAHLDDRRQLSRIDATISAFQNSRRAFREQLESEYQLRWYSADEELSMSASLFGEQADAMEAVGKSSQLGEALRQVVERQTARGTAAIVFVSDGINTSGLELQNAAEFAREARIPIFSCLVGQKEAIPDVRLTDLKLDPQVYLGDRIIAEFTVVGTNLSASSVSVRLLDTKSNEVLDTTDVAFNGSQTSQTARLSFVPAAPGIQKLVIESDSIPDELDESNNTLTAEVEVRDKTIRVLLLHDQPSYEFRFLKSLLDRSKQIGGSASSFDLTSVLQESDPDYVRQDPSAERLVPSSYDQISEYDVFIIGNFNPTLVSRRAQESIFETVTSAGAGCIFIYGEGDPSRELLGWPLAKLLPVLPADERFSIPLNSQMQWQPTPLGLSAAPMQLDASKTENARIWGTLPGFYSVCNVGNLKPGAQVLANVQGQQLPLLVTQFAGAGRVALQATDETFAWTSIGGLDTYHQRYWGQMLRWLGRGRLGKDIEQSQLIIEPKQASFGQAIRIEARLGAEFSAADLGQSVVVSVDHAEYPRRTLTLSQSELSDRVYQTTVSDFGPGLHQALIVQPSSQSPVSEAFTVASPPGEQANLRADEKSMRGIAETTGGRFFEIQEMKQLLGSLPQGNPTRLGTLPPEPIWNSTWIALLVVSLLTAEWLLRRKARLL